MNASAASALSRLEDILGESSVSGDQTRLEGYSIAGLRPSVLVQPRSAQEIADLLKFAGAENLAIVCCGARTKLGMGAVPQRYDIALDLGRLDRVTAYDPGDLTLGVEPGVPLCNIARMLGEHGQFLPLGAPFASHCSIGGTIISGVDGPLRQFYGTARDFVLGMEFVTGDGTIGKSGGRVVKNVSGYDLHKPLIGSLGTLAVVTKINLRTFPAPQSMKGFLAHFPTAESALALRNAVAKSPLRPLTLEILSAGATEMLHSRAASSIEQNSLPTDILSHQGWTFAASFSGNEAVLARYERELREMAESQGATELCVLGGGSDRSALAAVFGRIREFAPIALQSSPAATIFKLSVPPIRIDEALCAFKHAAEEHSLHWAALARGVGVIYAALLPTEENEHSLRRVLSAAGHVVEDASRLSGHASIPWCPAEWKSKLAVWGAENPNLPLMRKLKAVFDPRSILSPGRFVGGL